MIVERVRTLGVRFLALVLCLCAPAFAASSPKWMDGTIERILDGDTVWVQPGRSFRGLENTLDLYAGLKDTRVKVRMMGMDAPETHFPSPYGVVGQEPWGGQADTYLKQLTKVDNSIKLETWGQDVYGRTLAYVFDKNADLNLAMVRGGWSIPYIICSGRDCNAKFFKSHRVNLYLGACDAARSEQRGIWSRSRPLREMPFEFRMRMAERPADKFVGHYETMEYYRPNEYQKVDVCRRVFFMSEADAKQAGFKLRR